MLPLLIGGAVVAAIGYLANDDDDNYDECIYCSSPEYRDGLCRRHYREQQERENNKREIRSEIENFKNLSKRQIKDKYEIKISFNDANVKIENNSNSKITKYKNTIKAFEEENNEIQALISELEKAKDAI